MKGKSKGRYKSLWEEEKIKQQNVKEKDISN